MAKKYNAFLSYSHADEKFGTWLHKELESYKIPKKLQRDYPNLPKSLYPIFRDRYELNAGSVLGIEIQKALQNSAALIVICSTNSANSTWVNKEIIDFKILHGEEKIFPVIIGGQPFAKDSDKFDDSFECFPDALKYKVNNNGEISEERTDKLASDFNKNEDGDELAKLKLIAGLLKVPFGEFYRRDFEQKKRDRKKTIIRISLFFAIVTTLMVFALFQRNDAINEKNKAVQTRNESEKIIDNILFKLSNKLEERGDLDILKESYDTVDIYYNNLKKNNNNDISIKRRIAIFKVNKGKYFESIAEYKNATNAYQQALVAIDDLLNNDYSELGKLTLEKDRAGIFLSLGDMHYKKNSLKKSKEFYEKSINITRENIRTINKKYKNKEVIDLFLFDLSVYYAKLGQVLEKEENLLDAEKLYLESFNIRKELYNSNKENYIYLSYTASSLEKLGDVYFLQDKKDKAIVTYEKLLEYSNSLVNNDKKNIRHKKILSVAYERIGHIKLSNNDYNTALDYYYKSLDLIKEISLINTKNQDLMRDLATTYDVIGKAHKQRKDYKRSLEEYSESLSIRLKLNNKNLLWYRELGLCYENIGYLYDKNNSLKKSKTMYEKSFKILSSIAKSNSDNIDIQNDFISNIINIGDFFIENDLRKAEEIYSSGLKSLEKVKRKTQPMIINMAFIYDRLGETYQKRSKVDLAKKMYLSAHEISKNLIANNTSNSLELKRDLAVSYSRLGDISFIKKIHEDSKQNYFLALKIIEELLEGYPNETFLIIDKIEHLYKISVLVENREFYLNTADELLKELYEKDILSKEDEDYLEDIKRELNLE